MSDPTTSIYPVPVATSDTSVIAGETNVVRFSKRVRDWFIGLSPVGATVYDTGYVVPTLATGTGSSGFGIVRRGKWVSMRGVITPATNWGAAGSAVTLIASGGIPADMRPATTQYFTCGSLSTTGSPVFRVLVGADGALVVNGASVATSTALLTLTAIAYPV